MINLLAVQASPRKGKSTDTLVEAAIAGVRQVEPGCNVTKINLIDHDIGHCRNCLVCRDTETDQPFARCAIRDDMDLIHPQLLKSDLLIFGTPVHSGYATGLMTVFLERVIWVFAKPDKNYLWVRGCPLPRSTKKRKAAVIVTSGIIPPLFRRHCDQASPLIRQIGRDALNAKTIGDLYAGDIEHRGVDRYRNKAFRLGQRLAGK